MMRRKQFIDHLARITEQNTQINCFLQTPLFCCKQSRMNQRAAKPGKEDSRSHSMQNSRNQHKKEFTRPFSASKSSQPMFSQTTSKTKISNPSSHNKPRDTLQTNELMKRQTKVPKYGSRTKTQTFDTVNHRMVKDLTQKLGLRQIVVRKGYKPQTGDSLPVEIPNKRHSTTENSDGRSETGRILYASSLSSKTEQSEKKYMRFYPQGSSPVQTKEYKMALRKEINRNYRRPFIPPPKITAKSYIILEIKSNPEESIVVTSFNSKTSYQVASLTKIMTCIVIIQICEEFNISRENQQIVVGKMESSIGGTSAHLRKGQVYTIEQLLHGLMLPSGNDASLALAVWGGRKLLSRNLEQTTEPLTLGNCKPTKSQCYQRFLRQMNSKAKAIKMIKTNYANSHGLVNSNNKSSAYEVAILSEYAMKNAVFRRIVGTRKFQGTIRFSLDLAKRSNRDMQNAEESSGSQEEEDQEEDEGERLKKAEKKVPVDNERVEEYTKCQDERKVDIAWENTHKLLQMKHNQYIGIKTGFTTAAGPCLASSLVVQGRQFIIVVLGCSRMSLRFRETQILKKWLFQHEGIRRKKKKAALDESEGQEEGQEEKTENMNSLDDDREIED